MPSSCDVLVVGLGPAGGAAARAAAAAGWRVVAVDRKSEIGVPVQCAEFIPAPLGAYAAGAGVRRQAIRGMRSHLPSGGVADSGFNGWMVDRAAFDRVLADDAQRAGARLLRGTALAALDGRCARLTSETGAVDVDFRLLVAADGPLSRVARCLRLPPLKTVTTRQYTVPLRARSEHTDVWLSAEYPGGYAWLFPKGEVANLGLGADRRFGDDLKTPLDRLHSQLIDAGVVGADILCRTGGPIPVGGLRPRLVVGEALFVGDAGGFTHPITGAGIASAVISGERAGQACAAHLSGKAGALAEFDEDMRDQFESSLRRAVAARERMERHWNTPAATGDAVHRGGWIAFDEYYAEERAAA